MRLFSFLVLLTWSLAAVLCAPGRADTPLPQLNIIALGQEQVLEAQTPRQLTLDAHISEFAYQPGGLEIAYAGSETDGDTTTQFVKLVGTRHGTSVTLMTQSSPATDNTGAVPSFALVGWSADGRYLIIEQEGRVGADSAGAAVSGTQLTCVDVGASPMQLHPIALPGPVPLETASVALQARWSPSHTRLLLRQITFTKSDTVSSRVNALYDLGRDRADILPAGAHFDNVSWIDDTHLSLKDSMNPPSRPLALNVQTMKTEPLAPTPTPKAADPAVSPINPNIALDTQTQTFTDTNRVAQTQARALWVRRVRGPKALSALAIDVIGGPDDPQARWAQTGQQVAYLAHGDLFVADLSTRDATLKERYFAGDKLTCPEERLLAMQSLKQIGLAAIQYSQDYDESYPPQANVNDTLAPYLPPDALLQVGSAKFVYHAPADLSLAKMDSPADTVLGTMDLPCAQIVLYADGHVKALPVTAP